MVSISHGEVIESTKRFRILRDRERCVSVFQYRYQKIPGKGDVIGLSPRYFDFFNATFFRNVGVYAL